MAASGIRGFSKKDWLDAALDLMGEGSLDDLKIQTLAKRLGVNKSGFYWHFSSRQALVEHLLDYWSTEMTESITDSPVLLAMEPKKRLCTTAEAILEKDLTRHDIAVRQWARKDQNAEKQFRKVIQTRFDFIKQAFFELGFKGDDLDTRAMLFVAYHTWESATFDELPKKRLRELITRRIDLLTS